MCGALPPRSPSGVNRAQLKSSRSLTLTLLDFSCAIFTPEGDLVVNAPHIPVHLGAMSQTVKQIIADNPAMRPGDVFVTNDPYRGGSHLPDITVITPVFADPTTLSLPLSPSP